VPLAVNFIGIDTDFLATYEMELASGRNFSEAQGRDSAAVLLNETAARQLGVALPLRGEPDMPVSAFFPHRNQLALHISKLFIQISKFCSPMPKFTIDKRLA
jgi:hypothetical protein